MTTQPPASGDEQPADDEVADDAPPDDAESSSLLDRMPPWSVVATVLFLVVAFTAGFVWLTAETFDAADGTDPGWSRRLYVFQSLFAIITAIVGAIFSATVYRPQLKKAATDRRKAEDRAQRNAGQANSAREHGERRAAETRERILEEAVKRQRQPLVLERNAVEDPKLRDILDAFQESDNVGYMPNSPQDPPPDFLTIDDLAEAIAASRTSEPLH